MINPLLFFSSKFEVHPSVFDIYSLGNEMPQNCHSGEGRNPGPYWMPVEDPVFSGDQVRHDDIDLSNWRASQGPLPIAHSLLVRHPVHRSFSEGGSFSDGGLPMDAPSIQYPSSRIQVKGANT
jgi:hypothetical protein